MFIPSSNPKIQLIQLARIQDKQELFHVSEANTFG
jgi:hypothetical protein